MVHPKVKASAAGAAGGTVVGALITILIYYVTPLVPAEVQQPVVLLITIAVPAGCAAAGSYIAGYLKSGDRTPGRQ